MSNDYLIKKAQDRAYKSAEEIKDEEGSESVRFTEKAFILSVIQDPSHFSKIQDLLPDASFFYDDTHAKIYTAMLSVHQKEKIINIPNIIHEDNTILFNEISDLGNDLPDSFLSQTVSGAFSPELAKNVQENGLKRTLVQKVKKQESLEEVIATAQELERKGLDRFYSTEQIALVLYEKLDKKENYPAYPFWHIQEATGGIRKGEVIIIAARPGTGKSVTLQQIALFFAKQGKRVLFISAEMPAERISERIASSIAQISWFDEMKKDPKDRNMSPLVDALAQIEDLPIFFHEATTINQVEQKLTKYKNDFDLVVIDYLSLFIPTGDHKNSYEKVTAISSQFTHMAKKYSLPFIIASQYNRTAEGKQPTMGELRDSGQIEQDADVIISLWSNKTNDIINNELKKVRIDLLKNRNGYTFQNGNEKTPATYFLIFKGKTFTFFDQSIIENEK